jgi:cephalosporin hydroxylase
MSTKPSDKWLPYFEVYDRHLKDLRPKHLVEVGVQGGGSLEMWSNLYGGSCKITGIDIDPKCAELNYHSDMVSVIIGDQGTEEFWNEILPKLGKIDIFVDDGGHFMNQQILTFEKVFPKLSVGGIYICEDTHTSYMNFTGGGLYRKASFIEYSKRLIDTIHRNWFEEMDSEQERLAKITKDLTSIHFYDSMCVFEKFGKKEMTRELPEKFRHKEK